MRPDVARAVRAVYDAVGEHGSRAPGGMDLPTGRELAVILGYAPEALAGIPGPVLDAFVGAGPLATLASPSPGEVIVDVGCGAGLDTLLATLAGARVVALDASAPMLGRLDRAARALPEVAPPLAVRGEAPHLPLAAAVAHRVWLNGVANLVPARTALCAELARVLRPGGQLLLADVFAREPVPAELRELPEAWAWCVAGAASTDEWQNQLARTGFEAVSVEIAEEFPPFCRGVLRATRGGIASG